MSLLVFRGPHPDSDHLLVVAELTDLKRALTENVESLVFRVQRSANLDQAWIKLPRSIALEEGQEFHLQASRVNYGPNSARIVYQGPDFGTARFGYTRNVSGWSSFPPHGFERGSTKELKDFSEQFMFCAVHNQWGQYWPLPPGGYLISKIGTPRLVFDGLTFQIKPGLHAVIAAPGCELGYIWAYTCSVAIKKEIRDGKYLEDTNP
jgi:hypothetical protein